MDKRKAQAIRWAERRSDAELTAQIKKRPRLAGQFFASKITGGDIEYSAKHAKAWASAREILLRIEDDNQARIQRDWVTYLRNAKNPCMELPVWIIPRVRHA